MTFHSNEHFLQELKRLLQNEHNTPADLVAFKKAFDRFFEQARKNKIQRNRSHIIKNIRADKRLAIEEEAQQDENKAAKNAQRMPKHIFVIDNDTPITPDILAACQERENRAAQQEGRSVHEVSILQNSISIDDTDIMAHLSSDHGFNEGVLISEILGPLIEKDNLFPNEFLSLTQLIDQYQAIPFAQRMASLSEESLTTALAETSISSEEYNQHKRIIDDYYHLDAAHSLETTQVYLDACTFMNDFYLKLEQSETGKTLAGDDISALQRLASTASRFTVFHPQWHTQALNDLSAFIDSVTQHFQQQPVSYSDEIMNNDALQAELKKILKYKEEIRLVLANHDYTILYDIAEIGQLMSYVRASAQNINNILYHAEKNNKLMSTQKQTYHQFINLYRATFKKFDMNYFQNTFLEFENGYATILEQLASAKLKLKEIITRDANNPEKRDFTNTIIALLTLMDAFEFEINLYLENGITVHYDAMHDYAAIKYIVNDGIFTQLIELEEKNHKPADVGAVKQILLPTLMATSQQAIENKKSMIAFAQLLENILTELDNLRQQINSKKKDKILETKLIISQARDKILNKLAEKNNPDILFTHKEATEHYLNHIATKCNKTLDELAHTIPEHRNKITQIINAIKNFFHKHLQLRGKPELKMTTSALALQATMQSVRGQQKNFIERAQDKIKRYFNT